jgi:hypothetical protein
LAAVSWAALGSTVALELATGVVVAVAFFAAPAGAFVFGGVLWVAPVALLLRGEETFAVG